MKQDFHTLGLSTHGPGLYEITAKLAAFLDGKGDGLVTCFIRHTSASLLIQENADPDVQSDLKDFFARWRRPAWITAIPRKAPTTCRHISVPP
jgi:thiamine phosphate synthase YjbQ (UPF0047 family)